MEAIGGASAIMGIVQIGLSFAVALNTYISDVHDAREDILSLVSDIESTFGQLRDLSKLIEMNQTTHAWSEDGLKSALKCVSDCEKVISKLRNLLKKSTASAISEDVERDEIDVTKFEEARWPLYKPELELRRRELQKIKQDILIAYSAYMTTAGATTAERKRALDDLPRLERTREHLKKQVQEAKENRLQRSRNRSTQFARSSRQTRAYVAATAPAYDESRPYVPIVSDDDPVIDEMLEEVLYNNMGDLQLDFEDWAAEREERKRIEAEERQQIEEAAIEAWKKKQQEEAEAQRQRRAKLGEELKKQRMAPQQIEETLDHMYPLLKDTRADTGALTTLAPKSAMAESVISDVSQGSRPRSLWSRV